MPRKAQYEKEKALRHFLRACKKQGARRFELTTEERKAASDELGKGLPGDYSWGGLTFDELGEPTKPVNQGTMSGSRNKRLAAERRENIRELCPDIWGNTRKIKKIVEIAEAHDIKVSVRTLHNDFQCLPKKNHAE